VREAAFCAAVLLLCAGASAAEKKPRRKVINLCGNRLELMTADEVKALGFPWIDVPDKENAATYHNKGANALYALKEPDKWDEQYDHARKYGWDDGMKELGAYLDAARPALAYYRKGASMKLCQLHYPKADMLAGMLLPGLGKARSACWLLVAEARRFEAKGQFKEAIDNYLAVVRIGRHYGTARTMIDYLVGIACVAIGTQSAFKGVYRYDYPEKELRRFLKELDALRGNMPDYAHAMRSERAFGLGTVDDIMRLGPGTLNAMTGTGPGGLSLSPLQVRFFRILFPDRTVKKDMANFYDRTIAAGKKPYYTAGARKEFLNDCKPWNVFAGLLLPAVTRARVEAEKCRAMLEMLRVALALKMYHRDMGVYPDRLDWLVADKYLKAVPADPFSGKPLKYKLDKGEFVLYSVGEDMKDNGGALTRVTDFISADYGFRSKLPPAKKFKK